MSLIQRTTTVGLDSEIDRAQQRLYNKLNPVWGGDWSCFPRIYKNKRVDNDGQEYFVPEYLDGIKEYTTDTLFNDRVDVTSFFLEGDNIVVSGDGRVLESDVSLIFSCLIDNIYSSSEKMDMKMRADILSVINKFLYSWELENVYITVDEVYREFRKEDLNFSDLSNRHLLRFDFKVKYSLNC